MLSELLYMMQVVHTPTSKLAYIIMQYFTIFSSDFALSPKLSFLTKDLMFESTKRVYTAPEVIRSRKY